MPGRPGLHVPPILLAVFLSGCGTDVLGPPPSVKNDGFRASASVEDGSSRLTFELAARGGDVRRDLGAGKPWPILILRKAAPRAFELDPAGRRYRELDPGRAPSVLPDFPLAPGFSEHQEAGRRGLTEFYRESDAVFAGNACQLWRFEDRPSDFNSPSTTYWVAPALDNLVVRLDRDEVDPVGGKHRRTVELRNVRPGARPELFDIPSGYTRVP